MVKQSSSIDQHLTGLATLDDPKVHHGAPASIQLIGRKLDEERLLSLARLVVTALQQYKAKYGHEA